MLSCEAVLTTRARFLRAGDGDQKRVALSSSTPSPFLKRPQSQTLHESSRAGAKRPTICDPAQGWVTVGIALQAAKAATCIISLDELDGQDKISKGHFAAANTLQQAWAQTAVNMHSIRTHL
jgi:hypothetical protein